MVIDNEEDFFFLTGTESGFLRHSRDGGNGCQKNILLEDLKNA